MPDATILLDYSLARLTGILEKLSVHTDRMRENMDLSYGLYFSQRVLTSLIESGMQRQRAYEAVQRLAMQSWNSRIPFPRLVRENAEIREHLGEDTLTELFDPAFYLRYEDAIFSRLFENGSGEAGK